MTQNGKTSSTAGKAAASTKKPAEAGEKADRGITKAAEKTSSATRSAGEAVEGSGRNFGDATRRAGHVASRSAEAGRQKLVTVSSTAATAASATWTVVKNRKAVAAGLGTGALTAFAATFAAGRYSVRRRTGPFTRFTGGRL
ncbi:hypothetical protein [Streptomyces sp. WMMB 322]|uniref:hypothetical protein n=1 Tax=Streptomyces sp. WMMB 322 TaxID=1286821 RepID=UPI0006E4047E|nr:hypothetical protein [Streptomyces sp. WMMB 322]